MHDAFVTAGEYIDQLVADVAGVGGSVYKNFVEWSLGNALDSMEAYPMITSVIGER